MGYASRQSLRVNIGEELFLDWCQRNGWGSYRIGFDEKAGFVKSFYQLSPLVRNIPDFVIEKGERVFLVNVKGTSNIKRSERMMLPSLSLSFGSPSAPLVYAFCFQGSEVVFASAEDVIGLYDQALDRAWPDGVVYRSLAITNGANQIKFRSGRRGGSGDWQEVLSKLSEAHAL